LGSLLTYLCPSYPETSVAQVLEHRYPLVYLEHNPHWVGEKAMKAVAALPKLKVLNISKLSVIKVTTL
jgi:hypothetical protein